TSIVSLLKKTLHLERRLSLYAIVFGPMVWLPHREPKPDRLHPALPHRRQVSPNGSRTAASALGIREIFIRRRVRRCTGHHLDRRHVPHQPHHHVTSIYRACPLGAFPPGAPSITEPQP